MLRFNYNRQKWNNYCINWKEDKMSAIFHCKFDPNFTELHILILNMAKKKTTFSMTNSTHFGDL